jgi:hypothetical protein
MSRMVGASFGVAALGAVFQHLASDRLEHTLAGTGLTAGERDQLVHSLGSGGHLSGAGLDPGVAAQVGRAARDAFVHALASGMWLSAGLTLAGALTALAFVEGKCSKARGVPTEPEAAAQAAASSAAVAALQSD